GAADMPRPSTRMRATTKADFSILRTVVIGLIATPGRSASWLIAKDAALSMRARTFMLILTPRRAEILKQPGGIAYQIFDEKLKEAVSRYLYDGATPVIANSIKELAEMLEINPDALVKTVDEFNNAVVEDRPFNELVRDGRATKGLYPPKTNW